MWRRISEQHFLGSLNRRRLQTMSISLHAGTTSKFMPKRSRQFYRSSAFIIALFVLCGICLVFELKRSDEIYYYTVDSAQNRSSCCTSIENGTDICGRPNCEGPCNKTFLESSVTVIIGERNVSMLLQRENAFLIESTGRKTLNYRQLCSVESLAFHNPNLTIYVLFADRGANVPREPVNIKNLQVLNEKYGNINAAIVDLNSFMSGTQLEHWYHCSSWRDGPYHVAHLSDALRLLTLSKFGGYYFDLDLIHVRPVTHYKNFVALVDLSHVGNAAIHFQRDHPIAGLALEEFHKKYQPDVWGQNGPVLLSHVLQRWCGVKDLSKLNYITCRGFNVFPFSSFYPVYYNEWKDLFAQPAPYNLWDAKWFNELVIAVHTWNNLDAKQPVFKTSSQVYAQLARFHCPATISLAPKVF